MISFFFPYMDFIFLLQLDEYLSLRYFFILRRFFFRRRFQRLGKIKITVRVQCIFSLALVLHLFALVGVSYGVLSVIKSFVSYFFILLFFTLSLLLTPLWVGFANVLLMPFFDYAKNVLQKKAEQHLDHVRHRKRIIVIAGSFGKTTVKNYLQQILSSKYRVQKTPGNINTPSGIAKWILSDVDTSSQILLIESDGFSYKEFIKTGAMTKPDILVITNIGDQHLERFGTRSELARSLFSLVNYVQSSGIFITTEDAINEYRRFWPNSSFIMEGIRICSVPQRRYFCSKRVIDEEPGASVNNFLPNNDSVIYQQEELYLHEALSSSSLSNLQLSLLVAEEFSIPIRFVRDCINKLQLPERRQQLLNMYNFLTLDDSYNISPTTAKVGLEQAKKLSIKHGRKLLIITGGIPELGKENSNANEELGFELGSCAQAIILLRTIFVPELLKGLQRAHFPPENLVQKMSMKEAWEHIKQTYSPNEYIILMQPELTDLYY